MRRPTLGDSVRTVPIALVLLCTAVGAALRFATIGRQSYWYDEAVTASLLDRPFGRLLSGIVESESTPPLYYVLGWIWVQIFGSTESALRSLSAVVGTLTIPLAYAAGRVLVSSRAGAAAAALACVSPLLVWYSQEARAYALLVLLGGGSFVLFALARSQATRGRLALWALVAVLALATHYFAAFVVFAEVALLIWAHPRLTRVYVASSAVVASALALLPLAAVQASHRHVGWIGTIDLARRFGEAAWRLLTPSTPSTWAGAIGAPDIRHAWLAALVVVSLAALLLAARGSPRERLGGGLSLTIAAAAIVAPVAISLGADVLAGGEGDLFLDRNVLGAWVPLTVFVAAGLTARRAGLLGLGCLAILVAGSFAATLGIATTHDLQRDDWRRIAELLPSRGAAVAVYPRYQSAALVRQRPELEGLSDGASVDRVVLVLAGFDRPPAAFRAPDGFDQLGTVHVQSFTVVFFAAPSATAVGPHDLVRGQPEAADVGLLRLSSQRLRRSS